MNYRARALALLIGLILFSLTAGAQAPSGKSDQQKVAAKPEKNARPTKGRADPLVEQRRNAAVSLLTALADEAKAYQDHTLRARVLARAGDALWPTDAERARALFYRAWDAAVAADEESARRLEEEIRRQQQSGGAAAVSGSPNIRNEVLRLAARRDRALGEEFLKKLEEAKERETAPNSLNRDPWMSSASQSQRFRLATQLLQDGDTERALQYADPALTSVTRDSINFLSALREKDAAAADQRYAALLRRAESDPAADANTVSGLSSYAFTPFLYVVFQPQGGASQMQQRQDTPAPDLPPALRKAFFNMAAQILLRPSPPPEQDTTSAGRSGKYLIIKRLLPLFERYAPEHVAELRVQMTALMSAVPDRLRTGENRAVTRGIVPEDNSRDPEQAMQERLGRATNAEERDAIYADFATAFAASNDPRGRELVDKIEDSELRKQTRSFTDFQYLDNALQKKDTQEAVRLARSGELTHLQRVWGLTQAARQLTKTDRARAADLLDEALTEARRIDASNPERPRALAAIISVFVEADRSRVWELLTELVKAGNSAEGFTGDDARLSVVLRFRGNVEMRSTNASDFNLLGVFRALAKEDFYQAAEAAKNFTSDVARANAILAVTRTALEEKQK